MDGWMDGWPGSVTLGKTGWLIRHENRGDNRLSMVAACGHVRLCLSPRAGPQVWRVLNKKIVGVGGGSGIGFGWNKHDGTCVSF